MKNCLRCNKEFKPKRKEQKYCKTYCSNARSFTYDMVGKTFGQLTVVAISTERKRTREIRWLCKCKCGQLTVVSGRNLRSGAVKSCGCVGRQKTRLRNWRHGFTHTRFYTIYRGIRERCEYPQAHNYNWYGGKGIKCMWRTFAEFKRDMYKSYLEHIRLFGAKNTTINRLDPDYHYCKENCEWATWQEQLATIIQNRKKDGTYGKSLRIHRQFATLGLITTLEV